MKDGLAALQAAVAGLPEQMEVERSLQRVSSVDAFGHDFRLNASLSYDLRKGMAIRAFAQNLLGASSNKRYSYDFSGTNRASPHRVRFIEEPRAFGISVDYGF